MSSYLLALLALDHMVCRLIFPPGNWAVQVFIFSFKIGFQFHHIQSHIHNVPDFNCTQYIYVFMLLKFSGNLIFVMLLQRYSKSFSTCLFISSFSLFFHVDLTLLLPQGKNGFLPTIIQMILFS